MNRSMCHCGAVLPDGTRRTYAEHCRTEHPERYEVAARSDEWDGWSDESGFHEGNRPAFA